MDVRRRLNACISGERLVLQIRIGDFKMGEGKAGGNVMPGCGTGRYGRGGGEGGGGSLASRLSSAEVGRSSV